MEGVEGRDIYYRDTTLFKSQGTVDRIVDSLAYTLLIPRICLHVVKSLISARYLTNKVAAAKGLISGHATFEMKHSAEIIPAISSMVSISLVLSN